MINILLGPVLRLEKSFWGSQFLIFLYPDNGIMGEPFKKKILLLELFIFKRNQATLKLEGRGLIGPAIKQITFLWLPLGKPKKLYFLNGRAIKALPPSGLMAIGYFFSP